MALLQSELERIKIELGWNGLAFAAEPYVGIAAVFESVVRPYLLSGLITTSATVVTAANALAPVALTLAATSGTNTQGTAVTVSPGDTLVIDVDDRQETAKVQSLSGAVATVHIRLAHSGTYPVTVEGAEAYVRECLRNCRDAAARIANSAKRAGVRKVDEIEFFEGKGTGGSTVFKELVEQRDYWRGELYRTLFGQGNRGLSATGGSGGSIAVY